SPLPHRAVIQSKPEDAVVVTESGTPNTLTAQGRRAFQRALGLGSWNDPSMTMSKRVSRMNPRCSVSDASHTFTPGIPVHMSSLQGSDLAILLQVAPSRNPRISGSERGASV